MFILLVALDSAMTHLSYSVNICRMNDKWVGKHFSAWGRKQLGERLLCEMGLSAGQWEEAIRFTLLVYSSFPFVPAISVVILFF